MTLKIWKLLNSSSEIQRDIDFHAPDVKCLQRYFLFFKHF